MTDRHKSKFDRRKDVYLSMLEHFRLTAGSSRTFEIADTAAHWPRFHTHTAPASLTSATPPYSIFRMGAFPSSLHISPDAIRVKYGTKMEMDRFRLE